MNAPQDRPIWLTTLADADRTVEATAGLGEKILRTHRRQQRLLVARRASIGVGLAAALTMAVWLPGRLRPPEPPFTGYELDDEAVAELVHSIGVEEGASAEFLATHLASAQPLESVRIVRVSMPSAQLASYGVSPAEFAAADEVTADLLVGQDGIARAIRVVR